MSSLADRAVLLTGALGSLGRAQAEAIAARGARIALLDRPDVEGGPAFAKELSAQGARAAFLGVDLNDLAAASQAVGQARELLGQDIDILINNAALIEKAPLDAVSLARYEEQIRVNSSAAFALIQAAVPAMKVRGYGKIVNFCSITLNGRWDEYAAYVASKGALLGLTKALARELGPSGIRVNAISPGAVVSAAEARVFGDRAAAYNTWVLENQSIKVRIQPADIAAAVIFLISPESDMISGHNLAVDGGW